MDSQRIVIQKGQSWIGASDSEASIDMGFAFGAVNPDTKKGGIVHLFNETDPLTTIDAFLRELKDGGNVREVFAVTGNNPLFFNHQEILDMVRGRYSGMKVNDEGIVGRYFRKLYVSPSSARVMITLY
jgi:hypothetical protein